jgi:hypothetical protein
MPRTVCDGQTKEQSDCETPDERYETKSYLYKKEKLDVIKQIMPGTWHKIGARIKVMEL